MKWHINKQPTGRLVAQILTVGSSASWPMADVAVDVTEDVTVRDAAGKIHSEQDRPSSLKLKIKRELVSSG
ncbi:MAG: hypothetical protein GF399_02605 [Candidatus Coatesbacteria bacterium]|nr:hypothetical protein [Candidatus Coatesbacteria bacterium]